MKTLLTIVAGVVVFIAIALGAVIFFVTSGVTSPATSFFNDIKAQQYSAAYKYLSQDFKADTSQAQLRTFLGENNLLHIKDTSWGERVFSGRSGSVKGTVITDTGEKVPVKLSLVKEDKVWKIFSLVELPAESNPGDHGYRLPPNEELLSLADESMHKFAEAVKAKSFDNFRAYVSHFWQRQNNVEQFNRGFKSFIDANINMLPALNVTKLQIDGKPSINNIGVLEIDGHYPTKPSRIMFKLKYIYEGLSWKLVGVNVNIR